MQSLSCEMPGWMKHKLESRLPGEISITSDRQKTLPFGRKWRIKEPVDDSERGERKSWLKTQHSENEDHGIQSHNLMVHQFSQSVQSLSRVRLCNPLNRSTPGLLVHHQLPEFAQTHIHRVRDAIQSSHPLSSPSPPAPNLSQHQSLFQWVKSSHEVAKVLELQL